MLSLIKRTSRKNIVLLTCAVLVTILAYIAGYLTSVSSATEAEPQVIKIVSLYSKLVCLNYLETNEPIN